MERNTSSKTPKEVNLVLQELRKALARVESAVVVRPGPLERLLLLRKKIFRLRVQNRRYIRYVLDGKRFAPEVVVGIGLVGDELPDDKGQVRNENASVANLFDVVQCFSEDMCDDDNGLDVGNVMAESAVEDFSKNTCYTTEIPLVGRFSGLGPLVIDGAVQPYIPVKLCDMMYVDGRLRPKKEVVDRQIGQSKDVASSAIGKDVTNLAIGSASVTEKIDQIAGGMTLRNENKLKTNEICKAVVPEDPRISDNVVIDRSPAGSIRRSNRSNPRAIVSSVIGKEDVISYKEVTLPKGHDVETSKLLRKDAVLKSVCADGRSFNRFLKDSRDIQSVGGLVSGGPYGVIETAARLEKRSEAHFTVEKRNAEGTINDVQSLDLDGTPRSRKVDDLGGLVTNTMGSPLASRKKRNFYEVTATPSLGKSAVGYVEESVEMTEEKIVETEKDCYVIGGGSVGRAVSLRPVVFGEYSVPADGMSKYHRSRVYAILKVLRRYQSQCTKSWTAPPTGRQAALAFIENFKLTTTPILTGIKNHAVAYATLAMYIEEASNGLEAAEENIQPPSVSEQDYSDSLEE